MFLSKNYSSPCVFNLNGSQVHAFFPNFSRACMFCNDDNSKLVPESMQTGVFLS